MLAGLTPLELGRLRVSVGYGTHKKGRPLSPVEVGTLLQKARLEGVSLDECAKAIQLDGTGHIGRFIRILDLPEDVRHLIDWGVGKDFIGFTAAVELTKLNDTSDQRTLAKAILSENINSKEVRQITQLRKRSRRSIECCVKEIIGMRPKIDKRYVFVGSVASENVDVLGKLTQNARDAILASGIGILGLRAVTGRLGSRFFTLVGNEDFDTSMHEIGKENIEARLRSHISESVENAGSNC